MSKLIWDKVGERLYETGVKQGVLYPQDTTTGLYPQGVAWNGLTAVTESPSGAEANPIYADDTKYLNLISAEEFGCTIEAYTYPDEFAECDGSIVVAPGVTIGQQKRRPFGLCYRTAIGNDLENDSYGYKLHLVWGGIAAPSEKGYSTINDSPEAITLSWEVSTTPVEVSGHKPISSMTINSTKVDAVKLAALEDILYGTADADPRLPLPGEIIALFVAEAPSAVALVSSSPEDGDSTVALDSNIVLTFNNKILRESVVVISEAGDVVAGAKTWDAAGKVLTFNPTENLTTDTTYIVAVAGVVDIYGQALAASAVNFLTV
jgi:methionine-rich copper-binding protein CopC